MKLAVLVAFVLLSTQVAFASGTLSSKSASNGLDFAAPIVSDKTQLTNLLPFGSIVYDKVTSAFVGLDNTGTWQTLSSSGVLRQDGTTPLTGNWNVGNFAINNVSSLQVGSNNTPITVGIKSAEFANSIVVGDNNAGGLQFRNGAGTGTVSALGIDVLNNLYLGYNQPLVVVRTNSAEVARFTSNTLQMDSNAITNLADPSNAQDAATKNYVDSKPAAVTVQPSGVTPTCGSGQTGYLVATSSFIVCICNGSSWVHSSDGSTACSF